MNLAFACEPLTADLLREAIPLLREHWAEVAHYQDIPLDVDVEGYLTAAPAMRCFTARASRWRGQEIEMIGFNPTTAVFRVVGYEGSNTCPVAEIRHELVGYALFVVRPNLHYKQSLQASQDVLYLHPSVRGGTGARFIAYCDEQLQAEGVQAVYHHAKHAHPQLGAALSKLGYEPVETIYAKRLDVPRPLVDLWDRSDCDRRSIEAVQSTPRRRHTNQPSHNADLVQRAQRGEFDTVAEFTDLMHATADAWTGEDGG